MTYVLGYSKYAGQGGDWVHIALLSIYTQHIINCCIFQGAWILRIMGTLFSESLYAMHYNMFHVPITPSSDQTTYSEIGARVLASREDFLSNGFGYNLIQSTKASGPFEPDIN